MMASDWRSEFVYLSRYAGSGVLNTLVGFAGIFLLMGLGLSPTLSNVGGYFMGLIFGFFVAKKIVFRSAGQVTTEGVRYLAAFLVSFVMNLLALQLAMTVLQWNAISAQLLAAATYTTFMYLLSRCWVFRAKKHPPHIVK